MPSAEMEAEVAGVGSRPERQEGPRQALEPSTTCSWLGGEPGQMTGGFPHQLCKQSAQKEGFGLGSRKLNTVKKALESQSVDWHCTACILVASLQCQAQRWHRLSASRDFSRTTGSTKGGQGQPLSLVASERSCHGSSRKVSHSRTFWVYPVLTLWDH